MFRWLIQEQLTTRQIVKRLNALKIPTRTGHNSVWHVASVRCMLSNSIYTGQGYYNRTKSGVPRKETRRKFHPRTDNYAREPRPAEEWVPITASPFNIVIAGRAARSLPHDRPSRSRFLEAVLLCDRIEIGRGNVSIHVESPGPMGCQSPLG